jgi:preprotein translocase SecE subunit
MAEQVQSESRAAGHAGGSPLRVFKPGQGKWVRWCTAAGAGALAVAGAGFVREQLPRFTDSQYLLTLIPVACLLVIGYIIYWAVGRSETIVNFMIATEGEMKKVNWSSRKEVWGATRVVIVTVLALAFVLFVVDIIFMIFFSSIDVLQMDIVERFFGSDI